MDVSETTGSNEPLKLETTKALNRHRPSIPEKAIHKERPYLEKQALLLRPFFTDKDLKAAKKGPS